MSFKIKQVFSFLLSVADLYFRFLIISIILAFLIRLVDYVLLTQLDTFYPHPSALLLLFAFLEDSFIQLKYLTILFPVFLLLFFVSKKLAKVFWFFLLFLFTVISVALVLYTASSAVLLDAVVLSYSCQDALHVIQPYLYLIVWLILLPILLFAIVVWFYIATKNSCWVSFQQMPFFVRIGLALFLILTLITPNELLNKTKKTHYPYSEVVLTHKIEFLAKEVISYLNKPKQELLITEFQSYFPTRKYIDKDYPLLHLSSEYEDVLSPYFNEFDEKPNLVFVVMESLGRDVSGKNAVLGSFTPFLDSLAEHSLNWENFISTCERTYNIMPSMFGSLPYAEEGFVHLAEKQPLHYSLLHNLNNNGYYSSFFYGGWGGFDKMDKFFHRQNIDYFLQHFNKKYKPMEAKGEHSWGYDDFALFNQAMEVLDSVGQNQPRVDVYLTLTNHQPWKFNEQEKYIKQLKRYVGKSNFSESIKQRAFAEKDKYSAILSADDALRMLLDEYKKRPGFENTIFIFTGDHAIWNNPVKGIKRYHVPFLIYSPKLKQGKSFPAINTHLDVAPSMEAFLKTRVGLRFPYTSHYLGFTFDTSSIFRNQRIQIFKLNNKKVEHLIFENYYLDKNELFLLDSSLNQTKIENEAIKIKLEKMLNVINIIHEKLPKTDLIMPEVYYNLRNPIFQFFPIIKQTNEVKSIITEIKTQYLSEKLNLEKGIEFLELASLNLKNNTFNIGYVNIEFDYKITSNQKNIDVSLVLSADQRKGGNLYWNGYPLNNDKKEIQNFRIKETIILNEKNRRDVTLLKIYFWNKNNSEIQVIGVPKIYLSLE